MKTEVKYDLRVKDRHRVREGIVETEFVKLRKKINKYIYSTVDTWMKDDANRYFVAKQISERIFEHENDLWVSSILGVGFKRSLSEAFRVLMNDVIECEYSYILKLQYENENLQRRVSFLESLNKIHHV